MARFKYDEKKVSSALSELQEAKNTLDNVNTEINSGISIIQGARGSNFISVDFTSILDLKETSTEYIDTIIKDINKNVETIEDYNKAPWYKKVFASIGMAITKIGEGLGTGCEQIVDGFASLTGMVVGVVSKDAKEAIGDFVKKDHVGDAFAASYESGILSGIEKYSAFSSTSTAANVFKGVGVATTYVAIAAATGGVGAAVSGTSVAGGVASFAAGAAQGVSSIGLNAAIAGVGGLGAGTQSGLQEGKSYNSAFLEGVKDGAISAGTVYVAGKIGQKFVETSPLDPALPESPTAALPSGTETVSLASSNLADDASRLLESGKGLVASSTDDVASTVSKVASVADDASNTAEKIVINSGQVLDVDGSTAFYYAAKDATLAEKAGAAIKNVGLNISDGAKNISGKVSSAASAVGEKISPIATNAKEVFKTVGYEFATNPVAEGTVVAQTINGIRNTPSSQEATISNANYVFNSNGTVSEKTGETVSQTSEAKKSDETTTDSATNKNQTTSENVFNDTSTSKNNSSQTNGTTNTNTNSNTNTISANNSVENNNISNNSVDNKADSIETLETKIETPTNNNSENINSDTNSTINNTTNNSNENTSNNQNSNVYNEYTTNKYNNTNNYNTSNNYNTTNNSVPQQSGTTTVENTSTGTKTTVVQERIKYASGNSTVETPISNTHSTSTNKTVANNISSSTNTINPNKTTSTISNSTITNATTSTGTIPNTSYNTNTYKQTTTATAGSTSSASTLKKVIGAVAGVGATASAVGLGYNTYKKYENGEFPKKSSSDEFDADDEYNFTDGKWHDDDDTSSELNTENNNVENNETENNDIQNQEYE